MTEQKSWLLAHTTIPAKSDAAFGLAMRALQGHQSIDAQGVVESYNSVKSDVERLADGNLDEVRTVLAKMATLAGAAATRYLILAEQQARRSGEIEGRAALMRIALSAMRTHGQCLAALASLPVVEVE